MKKVLSLVCALALLATMTGNSLVSVSAEETQTADNCVDTEGKMLIYDTSDRRAQYQLTQNQLAEPTDVLIEYILDYPYLVDLYTANIPEVDTYALLCSSFNGLEELESREDAASALVKKYAEMAVSAEENQSLAALFLHTILSNPFYYGNLSEAELSRYNYISNYCGYTKTHSCTININNISTHTRTCTVCGWTSTEEHVANVITGKCSVCGLKGPFMVSIHTVSPLPGDENSCPCV